MSDVWTVVAKGLAQQSAQEWLDEPPSPGRFRSLAASVGEATVVVVTVVVPRGLALESMVRVAAEVVRQALVGSEEEGG